MLKINDLCNAINLLEETQYPLEPTPQECKNTSGSTGTIVADYACLRFEGNENQLLTLIEEKGPVVVAVDATLWQDYMGGIIQHHCYHKANHAVQIVGFNVEARQNPQQLPTQEKLYIFNDGFTPSLPHMLCR